MNKCGDQTDKIGVFLWINNNQFGFKSGHSTDLCIYALTECIEYLKSCATIVFCSIP